MKATAPARLTILFAGMIAADPYQGGATWAVLQYLLGLKQLGHDVYFVEPVEPGKLRPAQSSLFQSTNAAYFQSVMQQFGFDARSALLLEDSRETVGLPYASLQSVARRADVLINISGMLTDEALIEPIPTRVYLDLDPGFNQLWHAADGIDVGFDGHTHFVTVGQTIGRKDCRVPTCGLTWIGTLQPIVLDQWPVADHITYDAFTTVGNWRGYGSIIHQGVLYGQKAHTLRQFLSLPAKTDERFLLALAIHSAETEDLARLASRGWRLLDPAHVANTPDRYREFVQSSKAEFGIAKSGYAVARCGWFSDRSVCYLASGRPVIAQETGFTDFLPTGEGLLAFETEEDVLAGVEAIGCDYSRHARAARALAEECFNAEIVLPRLLARIGARS